MARRRAGQGIGRSLTGIKLRHERHSLPEIPILRTRHYGAACFTQFGARTLRVGQFVQAGTQLMAVVPLNAVYVVANFKETQLTHVRNGQPVEVSTTIDVNFQLNHN